ncbi:MAG: ABC transporter permease [Phycisphaerales bacterium]|nr:ABC transporter permease [Phycisphaerales bacterium]
MAITDFTIIRRSLTSRLFSTVTTALTVAIAVGLLLVLLSMMDAGKQAFRRGSGDMHLLVTKEPSALVSVLNGIFYANAPAAPLTAAEVERISADPRVAAAIPTQQGDSYKGMPVMATAAAFFTDFAPTVGQPWALAQGRAFDKPFEVVFGARAAQESGVRLGDTIYLTHGRSDADQNAHVHFDFAYAVVGILAPTGSAHDRAVFTDLTSAWTIHAHDRRERDNPDAETTPDDITDADRLVTGVYVRAATRPGAQAATALAPLAYQLRKEGFMVAEPAKEIDKLFTIVGNINTIFLAMAAVVMVSSAVSIMVALYNSMEQRRRQIAVLRVLGASRARVFGLILTESALLGLLGALAGVALALLGAQLTAGILKARLGILVTPAYPPEWILLVIVTAVALAALAGIVPAIAAYRTSVARNLRPAA